MTLSNNKFRSLMVISPTMSMHQIDCNVIVNVSRLQRWLQQLQIHLAPNWSISAQNIRRNPLRLTGDTEPFACCAAVSTTMRGPCRARDSFKGPALAMHKSKQAATECPTPAFHPDWSASTTCESERKWAGLENRCSIKNQIKSIQNRFQTWSPAPGENILDKKKSPLPKLGAPVPPKNNFQNYFQGGHVCFLRSTSYDLLIFSCIFILFWFWTVNEKSNKKKEV